MRTEMKWLQQHGVSSSESIAVVLGAVEKVRAGEYVGSVRYQNECRLAYQLVESMGS